MWQGTPSAQNDHLKQAVATYYKHYQTCLFVTVTPKNDSFFSSYSDFMLSKTQ